MRSLSLASHGHTDCLTFNRETLRNKGLDQSRPELTERLLEPLVPGLRSWWSGWVHSWVAGFLAFSSQQWVPPLHSEASALFSPCWQPRLGLIPLSPLLLEPHSQLCPEGKMARNILVSSSWSWRVVESAALTSWAPSLFSPGKRWYLSSSLRKLTVKTLVLALSLGNYSGFCRANGRVKSCWNFKRLHKFKPLSERFVFCCQYTHVRSQ